MPSLGGADPWLNTPPLTTAGLRGKVVLVDFWTYSCINWLRTLPYVRAWADKYRSQGLVVIGVHSPEFEFEKNVDNIRQAVKDMRVDYPVAVDSGHAVWRAFDNQYWPAIYLVDAQGRIRHHHFGEGGYERTERVIQQLLAESGSGAGDGKLVSVDARGTEVAADWEHLKSPETYIGLARTERFASLGGCRGGKACHPCLSRAIQAERLGPFRRLDEATRVRRAERARRADRLSLSCPRPSPRDGSGDPRSGGALSRAHRRTGAPRRSRHRCRRAGNGHRDRTAALPAGAAEGTDRRIASSRSSSLIQAWRPSCSPSGEALESACSTASVALDEATTVPGILTSGL